MTLMKAFGDFQKDQYSERNFRFGVREHGMGAIANGLAHHKSGLIPYCATFFIFTGGQPKALLPQLPLATRRLLMHLLAIPNPSAWQPPWKNRVQHPAVAPHTQPSLDSGLHQAITHLTTSCLKSVRLPSLPLRKSVAVEC